MHVTYPLIRSWPSLYVPDFQYILVKSVTPSEANESNFLINDSEIRLDFLQET